MLPKCHPELNFVELWWGARKAEVRKAMKSKDVRNVQALIPEMVKSFDSATVAGVAKMWNKSLTYVHAYAEGMSSAQAAEIAQKRASHRSSTKQDAEEHRIAAKASAEARKKKKEHEEAVAQVSRQLQLARNREAAVTRKKMKKAALLE